MNLYGDYANVTVLARRLQESGYPVEIIDYTIGRHNDLSDCDILICGCGTELATITALKDLLPYRNEFREYAESGKYMLFTGTAYGLLLDSITEQSGIVHAALGIISGHCVYDDKRRYSEFIMSCGLTPDKILGSINTSSTYKVYAPPFFRVLYDSNEIIKDHEGVFYHHIIATELQGPVLWRNPPLLDALASMLAGRILAEDVSDWRQHMNKGYEHLLNVMEAHTRKK